LGFWKKISLETIFGSKGRHALITYLFGKDKFQFWN